MSKDFITETGVIDGTLFKEKIIKKIAKQSEEFYEKYKRYPSIATIQVGDDSRSNSYVTNKVESSYKGKIQPFLYKLKEETTEEELIKLLTHLNLSECIDAILVQHPLPPQINFKRICEVISPEKDVDCFTNENIGKIINGNSIVEPCTPKGIVTILKEMYGESLIGKNVLIVGKGETIGKYLPNMLLRESVTIMQVHSKSYYDIEESLFLFRPQILISCVGKDGLINFNNTNSDLNLETVIDCGISFKGKQLRGDFLREDYQFLEEFGINYTPCKGGMGQVTVSMLLENVLNLANARQLKKDDN